MRLCEEDPGERSDGLLEASLPPPSPLKCRGAGVEWTARSGRAGPMAQEAEIKSPPHSSAPPGEKGRWVGAGWAAYMKSKKVSRTNKRFTKSLFLFKWISALMKSFYI